MSTEFVTPTEWKSSAWWANRSPDERLFHAKIPRRLRGEDDPDISAGMYADEWTAGRMLYMYGRSGKGKSQSAANILKALVTKRNMSGRFVTADIYIEMLKDQFDNDNVLPEMYSSPYLVKYIQGVWDVIVLDGVGQERQTEFASHEIGSLLRRRYDDERSIIVTTTLSPTDFVLRYGDRVKGVVNDMELVKF